MAHDVRPASDERCQAFSLVIAQCNEGLSGMDHDAGVMLAALHDNGCAARVITLSSFNSMSCHFGQKEGRYFHGCRGGHRQHKAFPVNRVDLQAEDVAMLLVAEQFVAGRLNGSNQKIILPPLVDFGELIYLRFYPRSG
jgi:hypothetical protein